MKKTTSNFNLIHWSQWLTLLRMMTACPNDLTNNEHHLDIQGECKRLSEDFTETPALLRHSVTHIHTTEQIAAGTLSSSSWKANWVGLLGGKKQFLHIWRIVGFFMSVGYILQMKAQIFYYFYPKLRRITLALPAVAAARLVTTSVTLKWAFRK